MTALGPRTVAITFHGGPADGLERAYERDPGPMPATLEHHLSQAHHGHYGGPGLDPTTDTWHYHWHPPRTGLRNPCRAGDDACPGTRCPSGRARQPR